jgi:hypothetical protein
MANAKEQVKQISPAISEDFSTITFNIRGAEPLVLDMGKLHPDVFKRAAAVGMAQVRIIDAAAIQRADGNGGVRTEAEMLELKRERMASLIEHYMSGTSEWTKGRAAGGGAIKEAGITLAAMSRVWPGRDCEELVAGVMAKRGVERKAALALFASTKEVAAAIAAIKAERATVSADSLLAEMDEEADDAE